MKLIFLLFVIFFCEEEKKSLENVLSSVTNQVMAYINS